MNPTTTETIVSPGFWDRLADIVQRRVPLPPAPPDHDDPPPAA